MQSYETLPKNLPVPEDDGACDHLVGAALPDLVLATTKGDAVNLSKLTGVTVVYCYPMTGKPGTPLPQGWDDIPGARGCTPQSCSFRDHYAELSRLGAAVYGMSTQDTEYQWEMTERLHLPFSVISDSGFQFCDAMEMPSFTVDSTRLMKRVSLIISKGRIEAVHYPVFPSDTDPAWVIDYLQSRRDNQV